MPNAYGKYAVVAITKRWRLFLTPLLFLFNQFISDGMKSFSNRRWADCKVWFNVPAEPVSACNKHGWPKVQRFDDCTEVTPPICD